MRKKGYKAVYFAAAVALLFLAIVSILVFKWANNANKVDMLYDVEPPEYVQEDLLPSIIGSRNGLKLVAVKNIVVHYVGNPDTTAKQNRDYFAQPTTTVNSHFIIGLDGEVIQCVPLYERSCATNHRNKDTISIEVCHPDESGKFNNATRESLVKLIVWLCETCDLEAKDVIRHYDVTGKLCPLYYVENEDAWLDLLNEIDSQLK